MRSWRIVSVFCALSSVISCSGAPPEPERREDAYRANNHGVALLEQFDYQGAAESFREATALNAALGIAHLNLAVALYHAQDFGDAERAVRTSIPLLPSGLQPPYLLGLIARAQNQPNNALDAFLEVLESDPLDVGANINAGQLYLERQEYETAIEYLRRAFTQEQHNVTASYNLGLALVRNGNTEEGQQFLDTAQALRATNYGITYGPGYLNEGRYAVALASTGAEPELVDQNVPSANFTLVNIASTRPVGSPEEESPFGRSYTADDLNDLTALQLAASLGGGLTAIDYDTDGDLDLFRASPTGEQLLQNNGSNNWSDVTSTVALSGPPPNSTPIGAVTLDYNNDHAPDLFVIRQGTSSLYRNDAGRFSDVTDSAGIPQLPYLPGAAAAMDVDHDGDADLLIAGLVDITATQQTLGNRTVTFPQEFAPAPLLLLRNNQNGTFTDITTQAGLTSTGHAIAIVPADFNNGRDIDLLIVDRADSPRLFLNQRDFTFRDVTNTVGLTRNGSITTGVTAADLNHDDYPDIVFAGTTSADSTIALSDGQGGFTITQAPTGAQDAQILQLFDYDNDGLLDLLSWTSDGVRLARNLGTSWADVSEATLSAQPTLPFTTTASGLVVADFDLDGDTDFVTATTGSVLLAENSGTPNSSLRVSLRGTASNRLGIGAKVQLRAGSLSTRLDTTSTTPSIGPADLVFGLGARPGADVVRVLWPSGIVQAEVPQTEAALTTLVPVQELDREPSSCPLLFTWNGTRFEFITDFLGGGEMGYWHGPDHYNTPDPVEYVRIPGDRLQPRDGQLELRITNELEEVIFFDHLSLISVSHPSDITVYPNEGQTVPPKPHRLHGVRDIRTPVRVFNDKGTDMTDRIAALDRRYPDEFGLKPFRGYAEPHTLTVDLGPRNDEAITLLLTGWTDYAFSSDNVAAHQAGLTPSLPALQIKNGVGNWRHAVDIGIPVGRPQTIALDLTGHLHPGEHEVRIVTDMRVYWDQIQVGRPVSLDDIEDHAVVREQTLHATTAELRTRGFSKELHPNGTQPTTYDYEQVSLLSPWKTMSGSYTRPGDVRELLAVSDDLFTIAKDGDEIVLSFDAAQLDSLPTNWTRTYLLRTDGFSKEMDINSASPDSVEPLPFHAMSAYPYSDSEHYPKTRAHETYRGTFNSRHVVQSIPRIDVVQ